MFSSSHPFFISLLRGRMRLISIFCSFYVRDYCIGLALTSEDTSKKSLNYTQRSEISHLE